MTTLAEQEPRRLAISFWIWALWDTGPNSPFHNLEIRMAELVERGFNCIRLESGACLTHDARGRPRGELAFLPALPGHARWTRQMEHMTGGRCNLLERLLALCRIARDHDVSVILSSWYFLHTFWFTDPYLNSELLGVPVAERFMRFAKGLDRILEELEQRGLADVVAFAEILNESDGLSFIRAATPENGAASFRAQHEDALAFLRSRHPDIRFALDTCSPTTNLELAPRNMQIWNVHSYYLWPVYKPFEGDRLQDGVDLSNPANFGGIRHFLRRDLVPFTDLLASRGERPPLPADWYRRIWLYENLDPNAMPQLERLLQQHLEANVETYKQRARETAELAVRVRDQQFPGVPLVLGEGASYCADYRLRWEERSDAYWEVVESAARAYRELSFWGAVARTNSGPEDPVWHEYPERLRRVNAVFLGKA